MKSNSNLIQVWGTSRYSLWDLSQGLKALNISHTIDGTTTRRVRRINLQSSQAFSQPMPVHLTTKLDGYRPEAVNFISAAVGALVDTNYGRFPSPDLETSLRQILTSGVAVAPMVTVRDAANYVENLAKPSLLNKLQTEINRIQPYSLRKQVQGWMLDYFNSRTSIRSTVNLLNRSTKTERLLPLFKEGLGLRDAVAALKTTPIEVVEVTTGFSSFELLYLTRAGKSVPPNSRKAKQP